VIWITRPTLVGGALAMVCWSSWLGCRERSFRCGW
jgi:hypothetical protein